MEKFMFNYFQANRKTIIYKKAYNKIGDAYEKLFKTII